MTRRFFTLLFFASALSVTTSVAIADDSLDRRSDSVMPRFSWDTLPLYAHVRKTAAFTADEAKYLAGFPLVSDAPIGVLVDGKLSDGYGPVFANGVSSGLYWIDLGESKIIHAITTWSTNKNGNRGPQKFTLYGSDSRERPGLKVTDWDVNHAKELIPLATIDTTGEPKSGSTGSFSATSLRSRTGRSLGTFRWIIWRVSPVTNRGENTAFQELHAQ